MNNPGLKPNIWYLVYEKNGAPALKVELAFDNIRDEHDLQQGQIVAIEGFEENGLVTVSKTTLLNIQ